MHSVLMAPFALQLISGYRVRILVTWARAANLRRKRCLLLPIHLFDLLGKGSIMGAAAMFKCGAPAEMFGESTVN